MLAEKVPAAQAVHTEGAAAPAVVPYLPAPQRAQEALVAAPVALDHVPLGQGVGVTEKRGQ